MKVEPLPSALRLDARAQALTIEWSDGTADAVSCRLLRERCMCAHCRSARQKGSSIEPADDITVTEAVPYGPNAVQLVFSDGHSRGIFPFAYLRELALEAQAALPAGDSTCDLS